MRLLFPALFLPTSSVIGFSIISPVSSKALKFSSLIVDR